jgi:predicted Fe-Mo cluster-binding NifX family protein
MTHGLDLTGNQNIEGTSFKYLLKLKSGLGINMCRRITDEAFEYLRQKGITVYAFEYSSRKEIQYRRF